LQKMSRTIVGLAIFDGTLLGCAVRNGAVLGCANGVLSAQVVHCAYRCNPFSGIHFIVKAVVISTRKMSGLSRECLIHCNSVGENFTDCKK